MKEKNISTPLDDRLNHSPNFQLLPRCKIKIRLPSANAPSNCIVIENIEMKLIWSRSLCLRNEINPKSFDDGLLQPSPSPSPSPNSNPKRGLKIEQQLKLLSLQRIAACPFEFNAFELNLIELVSRVDRDK